MHTYIHTDKQESIRLLTIRQTDIQKNKQPDRQTVRHTNNNTDKRQTNNAQTDRQQNINNHHPVPSKTTLKSLFGTQQLCGSFVGLSMGNLVAGFTKKAKNIFVKHGRGMRLYYISSTLFHPRFTF
jgi:predicted phage tail protein